VSERRHLLTATAAWVVLSVIGIAFVTGLQIIPTIASREADIENDAFVLLTALSVPVLMLVVVVLVYTALRFRAADDTVDGPPVDGPPVHGHTGFQAVWLGLSLVLVLVLFAYGSLGLVDIRGEKTADFEVHITAEQWAWHFEYPAAGVKADELHIPIDRRVHLTIESIDVIHSFWVPAFGVKQDAVPGHPTEVYMTATRIGTFPGMCSELCGLGHTTMTTTAVVSSQADLDTWLRQAPPEPAS
jgi:cytochrome c oxidase subunit II